MFPSHSRGLGERPKHQSPLIPIHSIKHSLVLWDGWHVSQVLTGGEKRAPASRCCWPQLMLLPWKLSRRKLCCGHEDWTVLLFLDLSYVFSDWGGSLDIHAWVVLQWRLGGKERYLSWPGHLNVSDCYHPGFICFICKSNSTYLTAFFWVLIRIIYVLTLYTYSRWYRRVKFLPFFPPIPGESSTCDLQDGPILGT